MGRSLVDQIKQISMGVHAGSVPMDVKYGVVTSSDPLKVTVDQRLVLSAAVLVVSERLTKYEVQVGGVPVLVRAGLEVGDKLILLRAHGGQKYIVMDRIAQP